MGSLHSCNRITSIAASPLACFLNGPGLEELQLVRLPRLTFCDTEVQQLIAACNGAPRLRVLSLGLLPSLPAHVTEQLVVGVSGGLVELVLCDIRFTRGTWQAL